MYSWFAIFDFYTKKDIVRYMKSIVQIGDEILRKPVQTVPIEAINTPKIQKIIQEMKNALTHEDDGVAIAAPQIGISLSIFVVSHKVFDTQPNPTDEVYINPTIIKLSRKKSELEEGCLSIRGVFGKIKRAEKATIEAYNEHGEKITKGGSGLLAQIFQHETDHLQGVLFIDSATQLIHID